MVKKGKMQVANMKNFIFAVEGKNFGGLYKTTQRRTGFLNTFTPCILQKIAVQF